MTCGSFIAQAAIDSLASMAVGAAFSLFMIAIALSVNHAISFQSAANFSVGAVLQKSVAPFQLFRISVR